MKKAFALFTVIASIVCYGTSKAAAQAWVSSTGNDSGPCTRSAPCATLQRAYDLTLPRGVISIVDSIDLAPLTIAKSLTIRAVGVDASINAFSGGSDPFIRVAIESGDTVSIDGLQLNGGGIQIAKGGTTIIRNCAIRFNTAGAEVSPTPSTFLNYYGIIVRSDRLASVVISDTTVETNGGSFGGAGIFVIPEPGGSAVVTVSRILAAGNQFGIAVDGTRSTAGINMTVTDSVLASNKSDGLLAATTSGGAPIGITVSNSTLTNNQYGIRSIGASAAIRADNSKIIGNVTGLTASGGALLTYGNNKVDANGSNGSFTGSVAMK